jgi:hypothetical protein
MTVSSTKPAGACSATCPMIVAVWVNGNNGRAFGEEPLANNVQQLTSMAAIDCYRKSLGSRETTTASATFPVLLDMPP